MHLQAIGHPVCGDPEYGTPGLFGLERQFLHAARLSFEHPFTGVPVEVSSPLPADLAAALARAEQARGRGKGGGIAVCRRSRSPGASVRLSWAFNQKILDPCGSGSRPCPALDFRRSPGPPLPHGIQSHNKGSTSWLK